MRQMNWVGSISWIMVVWVLRPVGRVCDEAVMMVQLSGDVEDGCVENMVRCGD